MRGYFRIFFLCVVTACYVSSTSYTLDGQPAKFPTVVIAVLVRNKAASLPYFLTGIYNLDYPKDRIILWFYSDFNEDQSDDFLDIWSQKYSKEYKSVKLTMNKTSGTRHEDEVFPTHWSPQRYNHVISLRMKAIKFAKDKWADFIFMIDADVFLTNPIGLKQLIAKGYTVVAPMLVSDGKYSNFWAGMVDFYYTPSEEYDVILSREKTGCFMVPMVHSAVLINLHHMHSDQLTYDPKGLQDYKGPDDDIIVFATSAKLAGVQLLVCNDIFYGYVQVPLDERQPAEEDDEQLINLKLAAISRGDPIPLDPFLSTFVKYPPPWTYGLDEIFMINLKRRPKRRELMEMAFKELNMVVQIVEAVDGKTIDTKYLEEHNIKPMAHYEDPFHKRALTSGEAGCFLSHYQIWEQVVIRRLKKVMVLEDDVRFAPYFSLRFLAFLDELDEQDWEFAYVGRKIMDDEEEEYVSSLITKPHYSYWTIGYLLSLSGAQKLIDAEPLTKLLPVDEFLPIMYDEHPNDTWKKMFPSRTLKAFSANPLLIFPTHYVGDQGYVSDTEDSPEMSYEPEFQFVFSDTETGEELTFERMEMGETYSLDPDDTVYREEL